MREKIIPCLLCGGDTIVFAAPERQYADCLACGFIALVPGQETTPENDKVRYLLHDNSLEDAGYRGYLNTFINNLESAGLSPLSSILDYGSGPEASLSALLEERAYRISCYDPFFKPDAPEAGAPYDCIVVHEVAEHFRNARVELGRIAALVSRPGLIALRTRFAPEGREEFLRWWYRQDITHRCFFRKRSWTAVARRIDAVSFVTYAEDTFIAKV